MERTSRPPIPPQCPLLLITLPALLVLLHSLLLPHPTPRPPPHPPSLPSPPPPLPRNRIAVPILHYLCDHLRLRGASREMPARSGSAAR
eukprot:2892933-Pyramimonas_sp.AAC.1